MVVHQLQDALGPVADARALVLVVLRVAELLQRPQAVPSAPRSDRGQIPMRLVKLVFINF